MKTKFFVLIVLFLFFAFALLCYGETGLNLDATLLYQLRLPKVITCLLAGGMLAVSGLLMQTYFQNPLAGPDILGVSSGSSLFVALFVLAGSSLPSSVQEWGMTSMSFLGSLSVFGLLFFFMKRKLPKVSLIIIGLLISSFASSGISILISFSQALQLKTYLLWSMGSFRNLTAAELPRFFFLSLCSVLPLLFFLKRFTQFILSENYARSMGVNIKKLQTIFIAFAAFQISIVTLYCGPIGFIGIIAPHLARQWMKTAQIHHLFYASFLIGSILAFLAELILVSASGLSLTVNSILGIIGAPVIILYLYRHRRWELT